MNKTKASEFLDKLEFTILQEMLGWNPDKIELRVGPIDGKWKRAGYHRWSLLFGTDHIGLDEEDNKRPRDEVLLTTIQEYKHADQILGWGRFKVWWSNKVTHRSKSLGDDAYKNRPHEIEAREFALEYLAKLKEARKGA